MKAIKNQHEAEYTFKPKIINKKGVRSTFSQRSETNRIKNIVDLNFNKL